MMKCYQRIIYGFAISLFMKVKFESIEPLPLPNRIELLELLELCVSALMTFVRMSEVLLIGILNLPL